MSPCISSFWGQHSCITRNEFPPSNLSAPCSFFFLEENRQVVPWTHPQRQLEATATQDTECYFTVSTWSMVSSSYLYQHFLLTGIVCSLISPYKPCLLKNYIYNSFATVNTPQKRATRIMVFMVFVLSRAGL